MNEPSTATHDGPGSVSSRVLRHALVDRLYHWLMAVAVFVLMGTAFLPILGIQFPWVDIHWISGVVLTVLVLFHIVRALVWLDWRNMMLWATDARDLWTDLRHTLFAGAALPARPGKYNALQKLYHLGIAVLILAVVASGLLMLLKIDTPFWRRDPYWFSNDTWGIIYVVHGFAAMAMVTMVIIHVYFALRPDEWYLTRSMFRGWISPKEYSDHHDAERWKA
ncbi:MAG: cytochrome b/b6 domain-containing protein [Xanthobacteraceae bacterium]